MHIYTRNSREESEFFFVLLWREVVLSEVLETGERETRDRGPARHRRLRAKVYVHGRDSKVRKKKKQARLVSTLSSYLLRT